ncbi:MAG TPA: CopD family protein [Pseudomonadales bacterium]|nr:CopD family protein [Pseudomonadales bacterium]
MTTFLILTRAVHIGSCLLFFGIFVFDCMIVCGSARSSSETGDDGKNYLGLYSLILLPIILISGAIWFVLVAVAMSGQPLQMETLKIVWTQTQFGTVWEIRLDFLLMAIIVATVFCFLKSQGLIKKLVAWFLLAIGTCLLGSLAWAGHGRENSPWHLFADVLHLLAAGIWPAGLLPLFLLLRKSQRAATPEDSILMAQIVRRFSAMSLAAVSLLTITGLINSWFLVGSFSNLFGEPYGRWLLAKVILFCAVLAIASVNLLRLKPRLLIEGLQPEKAHATVAQLQRNVRLELLFGTIIIVIVAILGILPPAFH